MWEALVKRVTGKSAEAEADDGCAGFLGSSPAAPSAKRARVDLICLICEKKPKDERPKVAAISIFLLMGHVSGRRKRVCCV